MLSDVIWGHQGTENILVEHMQGFNWWNVWGRISAPKLTMSAIEEFAYGLLFRLPFVLLFQVALFPCKGGLYLWCSSYWTERMRLSCVYIQCNCNNRSNFFSCLGIEFCLHVDFLFVNFFAVCLDEIKMNIFLWLQKTLWLLRSPTRMYIYISVHAKQRHEGTVTNYTGNLAISKLQSCKLQIDRPLHLDGYIYKGLV